jgi:tryptophanyl-tRNA synthetase
MKAVSSFDTVKHFDDLYNSMKIRYGDMKKQLAEDIITFTTPLRERIIEISNDHKFLKAVTAKGQEKARESALNTLTEARKAIGIRNF